MSTIEGGIADVQFSLFGGVGATTDDGQPVDVGPAKCQAVLAVIALSPGSAIPVGRIIALVWGDDPPRTADKTLQSYVVRLRKALGGDVIERVGSAYRLDVKPDAVDVARFQRALDLGDTETALAEWTGTPLAGLDADGLRATTDGLVEQYLGALEADLERQLATDAAATVGPLTELTSTYPFREGLWALLMTALYQVGRQADALAAYRRARQHLVEDLGVEPGARLREMESMVLGQDEQLGGGRGPRPTPGRPTGTVTFAFSDVESSTRMWSQHRADMAAATARHDEIIAGAVEDNHGYVFATGGDSFGVAFHRAGDAVRWAHEVQAAIAAERWPGEVVIRVRIGLHTGESEERGHDYFGLPVIVAARLSAAGHGDQILISAVTAALLDGVATRDLGTHRLDGVVAEQRILQLDDGDHPPLRIDGGREGNLPQRLGWLFGREAELDIVGRALVASPVVTLVGPGGIGKTRLAIAAARRADIGAERGAWIVELAAVEDPAEVPQAVARVLDVKERSGWTWTESIAEWFGPHRALVVLDNCEHVVDGAADVARAIANGCPNVTVLATSREGLGLADEQLVAVAPLDPAGAGVELFEARAKSASRSFDAVESRADVVEICARLDGVPLAIELAAARTRSLSPADLVARLDDRLRLLTGGRRASVERHRTLRATIQWSDDLLTLDEQMLFRRLSIFAGPFSLEAAEAVFADDQLDALAVD
ncbi:MAG: AfsR/SARP family transcriptional regulator, partial [Ilumatobacteraceae bacterium]